MRCWRCISMTDIEIPYEKDRHGWYRFFEILPGTLSWIMLALPFILSFINLNLAAAFILAYILLNFSRVVGMAVRVTQGYRMMRTHQKLDWRSLLEELESRESLDPHAKRPKWHREALKRIQIQPMVVKPSEIVHVIMIATYNESREVIEPTIQAVINSDYDMKKVILVIAYEERGGERVEQQTAELIKQYQKHFYHAMAVKHPRNIPGEVIGKGGNITYAGRELQKYLERENIDPVRVPVTTLDADNRPDKKYLSAMSYIYALCPDPVQSSFQPVSMYTNNIWDAPAPMRVVATGSSFFNIVLSLRPHALRNFSAHAQSMAGLIQTDFWSVRTIVEDGHQFWRSYFAFGGKYQVYPVYVPIYQDAVLTDRYLKTLKMQFVQLRRWAYGASDIAYVVTQGFFKKNKIPRFDLIAKTWRLFEGHVTWATGPLLVLFAGFVPSLVDSDSFAANEIPLLVSRVQTVALIGMVATVFFALKTLPPKPARYKHHRTLFMVLQWVYLPVTTIVYNTFAAIYSQTRLMFGKYYSKFDVTEKATVTNAKSK